MDTQPRIILVDDDNDDIALLKEALDHIGFKGLVVSFLRSQEFLDYYRKCVDGKVPNVVVLDWNMPAQSGADIIKTIAQEFPENLSSIVVFSTSIRQQDEMEALSWGAKAFFTKPHRFDDLVAFAENLVVLMEESLAKQDQRLE